MKRIRENQNKIIEEFNSKFDQRVEETDGRMHAVERHIGGVSNELKTFDERLRQIEHGAPDRSGIVAIGHMKPPEFSGQVPWAVYKRQFEAAAEINHWTTDMQKATALVLALRGPA